MKMKTTLLVLIITGFFSNLAQAQFRLFRQQTSDFLPQQTLYSPQPVMHSGQQIVYPTAQVGSNTYYNDEATWEASNMANRGFKGHIRNALPGTFVGVGWSSSPNNVPTCTPPPGRQLVGDSVRRGPDGYYRVRIWK